MKMVLKCIAIGFILFAAVSAQMFASLDLQFGLLQCLAFYSIGIVAGITVRVFLLKNHSAKHIDVMEIIAAILAGLTMVMTADVRILELWLGYWTISVAMFRGVRSRFGDGDNRKRL